MSTLIAGVPVVENAALHWKQAVILESPAGTRYIVCGETNQVRHAAWVAAWRIACREDLRRALASFADRVGIEYDPIQGRKGAPLPSSRETDHNSGE